MPFVDRRQELAWLMDGWPPISPDKAQLRIMYGRRRVGKSALLDEFCRDKRHVVYQAVEGTVADQLRDLTAAILACEEDAVLRAAPLSNWDAALAHFIRMAAAGPLLVVIDEYQYVAEADPTLASRLQRWWSREAVRYPIYVILCGSYVRFFTKNVLAGPAYGRSTGSWQLRPLGYRQAAEFFPGWAPEDRIRAFAVTGGVPHYLEQFSASHSLAWNITHNVLRRGAVLYQEAEWLMREELRDPRVYFSIVRAISDGCTKVGEITERVRPFSSGSDITPYLHTLRELGLVEYRQPVVGAGARRGIWMLVDPYLRFWFRFVVSNRTPLEHGGDPGRIYREVVAPQLDAFVSKPTFEEICRDWVLDRVAACELPGMERIGAWWGSIPRPTPENPRNRIEGEIEVVAAQGSRVVLAGEAKWTREPIGFGTLNHLRDVVRHVPGVSDDTLLVLFGRTFDPRLVDAAALERVRPVSAARLFA